ncbi:MAG: acetyl/propionyl/methylcrotonyl-CoA carboxylase subunit alpha [Nitriliruptoraceae bacterium]
MFDSLLVANRGEIACRVLSTARELGLRTIAVYSEADARARHVELADEAVAIGPAPAAESYLDVDALVGAITATSAAAVHPGYGFLSENAGFARAVEAAGAVWVGPRPETIEAVGDKRAAREVMAEAGVPVNGGGAVEDPEGALAIADRIGFPVMVKAAAGGGGIGMRIVDDRDALVAAIRSTSDQAARFFGDGSILLERYLPNARHVELQVLGLADGRVAVLGERDCSVQRRYQKVIEESPSPGVSPQLRARMIEAIRAGAEHLGYRNAGTFECLVSGDDFVFLEVNARLQVEHPVTEAVTGLDLVAEQLRIAAGEPPGFDPGAIAPHGHAIELRVYAEDSRRFLPRPGTIAAYEEPTGPGIRIDSGFRAGDAITPFYDPLIAKLVAHGEDRAQAIERARAAVDAYVIEGLTSNLDLLAEVLDDPGFRTGNYDTGIVARLRA